MICPQPGPGSGPRGCPRAATSGQEGLPEESGTCPLRANPQRLPWGFCLCLRVCGVPRGLVGGQGGGLLTAACSPSELPRHAGSGSSRSGPGFRWGVLCLLLKGHRSSPPHVAVSVTGGEGGAHGKLGPWCPFGGIAEVGSRPRGRGARRRSQPGGPPGGRRLPAAELPAGAGG